MARCGRPKLWSGVVAVPDFQTIMRPLLELNADGEEHPVTSLRAQLAEQFELSPEERTERLASGRQTRFANRVGWASTYLVKTGLLERPRRGVTRIRPRGSEMLEREPERIDLEVLSQFPEFHAFRAGQAPADTPPAEPEKAAETPSATPEEAMETAYEQLRSALAEELLDRVDSKFSLVTLAARRARNINSYFNQLGDGLGHMVPPQVSSVARKPLSIGFEEIAADKIVWTEAPEEAAIDEELVGDEAAVES